MRVQIGKNVIIVYLKDRIIEPDSQGMKDKENINIQDCLQALDLNNWVDSGVFYKYKD